VYAIDNGTGALTPVAGAPFPAGTTPLSVAVDDSGAWVYVSNQGSSDVSVYALDRASGRLSPVATVATPGSGFSVVTWQSP
jgi:6-phosphogluconolactonase (cycloisomerase 2 family)